MSTPNANLNNSGRWVLRKEWSATMAMRLGCSPHALEDA